MLLWFACSLFKLVLSMNCACNSFKASLSMIHTFTGLATIHHDSSRFELDGKIGVHRDGKKKI